MEPRPWTEHLPPGGTYDPTADRTLPEAWEVAWTDDPGRPVVYDATPGGLDRWVTAAEFEERTRYAAERLLRFGFEPGDRVLWSCNASLDAVVVNAAILRTGVLVGVPANPAYTERELTHIVRDARPAAAVVDDADRGRQVAGAATGPLLVLSPSLEPLAAASPAGSHTAVRAAPRPDAAALIAYTSGTTGAPKGAVLTHANLLAGTEAVRLAWRWEPGDRLVHALPLFHMHGLCVGLYGTLLAGASLVLLPGFAVDAVLDAVEAQRATLFFGVPTMYHRLAGSGRAAELGRLRLAVSGSAPLPAAIHHRLRKHGVDVLERYGMTETLMDLSNPVHGQRRAGTVGFPLPGVRARLADDGEIQLRGPNVFGGYWERPAANRDAFVDGWFRTGDLATVEDGYVRILGRSGDLVISGGFNVYPAEVEDVLAAHPDVAEVAVTGTPSEEWGEVVTAWVVAAGPPPATGALEEWAAARLAPYKRPRIVRFVDTLPRNAMGKIRRDELR